MTATGPRPDLPRTSIRGLAARLAAGLAPAAEALAAACAEDMSAANPQIQPQGKPQGSTGGSASEGKSRGFSPPVIPDGAAAACPDPIRGRSGTSGSHAPAARGPGFPAGRRGQAGAGGDD